MSRPSDTTDAPRERLAARMKRQRQEAEDVLGPEGRIRLALTLGLRAPRNASRLDRKLARVLEDLAAPPDDEPLP